MQYLPLIVMFVGLLLLAISGKLIEPFNKIGETMFKVGLLVTLLQVVFSKGI